MAIVKKYPAKVVSINNSIEGVYTLEFESLDKPFKYFPGQFLHLAIDSDYDGSGQWPDSRCFSMQSNPNEKNIKITYAVKGKFTQKMEKAIHIGSEIWLKLPYGDLFIKSHYKEKTVFIAGGTGITPFISLFTHESFKEYTNPHIYLGFRSKKYNIYQEKLFYSYNSNISLKIFYQNIDGLIDIKKIFEENGIDKNYFISGPPAMIKTFKKYLVERGVQEEYVLTDDWE